ncbi:MAG TPA: adenylyl-sulfate kinase [Egicoccus sp.]|nr:adenylyl-sulfate kinase [Egicoccus sp.]HSK22840.1 adenylyl-sulfate kinase [Egicoccus sp.]
MTDPATQTTAPVQPRWADAADVQRVQEASVAWPSLDLDEAAVDDLELVLDGLLEPQPFPVAADQAGAWRAGTSIALRDPEGTMLAALTVRDATADDAGVSIDGEPTGLVRPPRWSFTGHRHDPARLRELMGEHDQVVAVVTDRALHRDDVEDIRTEIADRRAHLLLIQLEDATDAADATAAVTRALLAALPELRAASTLALLPSSPRLFGDDRDERLDHLARALGADRRLRLGRIGADIEAAVRAGDTVATDATFAAVEAQLRAAHPPRHERGLVVLFTGLSGSGKSTVANALRGRLLERGDRRVTLLDGDIVRRNLSQGLGFSPADRATNVRRIGFVAAEIAHHGGIAICAPIAPSAAIRDEVAAMAAAADAGFVLVHVATPLEVCESRDRKGLYAKARAGIVTDFTGVDAPYEAPEAPHLRLDTTDGDPREAAGAVLALLVDEGFLSADR